VIVVTLRRPKSPVEDVTEVTWHGGGRNASSIGTTSNTTVLIRHVSPTQRHDGGGHTILVAAARHISRHGVVDWPGPLLDLGGAMAPIDCWVTGSKANQSAHVRDISMLRGIDIDIVIVPGKAGLIHARSRQMRSLMLMGRSEDELWRDMDPVLRDLLDIQGDKVVTMTIDRPGRRVRVDVE
jgi:hypothetical protein